MTARVDSGCFLFLYCETLSSTGQDFQEMLGTRLYCSVPHLLLLLLSSLPAISSSLPDLSSSSPHLLLSSFSDGYVWKDNGMPHFRHNTFNVQHPEVAPGARRRSAIGG